MKTYKLLDGISRIPSNPNVYQNKSKFDISLLNTVDTSVIYEEYDRRYNILTRLDNHNENSVYGVYRFYPNGYFNIFYLDRDKLLAQKNFDPSYTGYRGVYYIVDKKIRFDLFAEINQQQYIGKLRGTLSFGGDTLYVKRDDLSYTKIYIKRKLPKEYFMYKSDW